jgi:hypothetical protein
MNAAPFPPGAAFMLSAPDRRSPVDHHTGATMFFFFSNRLGCAGSILLSLAVTAVLLLVFAL